ncbi:Oidioi.mRNA.OKI2018_I69.XSR.g13281.t1.cds [Oikopleura dioica]|uniref:Oidioi.mRNA.OKI2018_I69.XSR.g13281.t1.cds n=1 Tax=Oikopleura dioica TaxID=34765 RepID=A0ABN7S6W6_OIKDI|nr:Oidioi.mRNA.OKI2018_I69.XSR.g13281.t1.cds [Oikopleura dioica]
MKEKVLLLLLALIVLVIVTLRIDRNVVDIKHYIVHDYSIEASTRRRNSSQKEEPRKEVLEEFEQVKSENAQKQRSKGPVKVLLITAHRSGSTFLGELFNQNPETFYLFEPLAGIQGEHSTLGCAKNPTKKLSLLNRYFDCDTPSFYQSVPVLDQQTKKLKLDKNRIIHGGKVKSRTDDLPRDAIEMEMPEHGRKTTTGAATLESAKFRRKNKPSTDYRAKRRALQLHPAGSLANEPNVPQQEDHRAESDPIVRHRSHRATGARSARAQGRPLLPRPAGHLRLQAQTRRPARSQTFHQHDLHILRKSAGFCFLQTRQLRRHSLRRHVLAPLETARKIYEFIGEPLPEALEKWIKVPSSHDEQKSKSAKNPYSTERNSTYTATKWRFENSFSAVDYVQKTCQSMMQKRATTSSATNPN